MSETTGAKGPVEEFEAEVFRALDRYFEARRREVEDARERGGPAFRAYEQARQQLMQSERELEEIQYRAAELKGEVVESAMGSSEASDLIEEVGELQEELGELQVELGELAKAEQSALGRKREAQERLRRAEQDFGEDLAEASSGLAGAALAKAEEIDAFKGRVDQRFAEGRTSVLEVAS
jgi:predicted  nucleic acid-binding Zn-ribbon protein